MKGIVFTEFLELVDETFSPDLTEELILECELPSGGAYTAIGTYDHRELITLVVALSKRTEIPVPVLVKTFGKHLFKSLVRSFPVLVDAKQDLFDFLHSVENYIHVEVRKLYPEAQLPKISCEQSNADRLVLHYQSRCPFAHLAEGLIEESAVYFKTAVEIERRDDGSADTAASFAITKRV